MNEEQLIMRQNLLGNYETVKPVVTLKQILSAQKAVKEVYMDEKIEKYILDLIFATRYPEKYNLESLKPPLISLVPPPQGVVSILVMLLNATPLSSVGVMWYPKM